MQFGIGIVHLQPWPFLAGLLDPVFSKDPVSGLKHWTNMFAAKRLAHRNQRYVLRIASGCLGGVHDPFTDKSQSIGSRKRVR